MLWTAVGLACAAHFILDYRLRNGQQHHPVPGLVLLVVAAATVALWPLYIVVRLWTFRP